MREGIPRQTALRRCMPTRSQATSRYTRSSTVPKGKWTQVRERFMKVLLEEHDAILRSYRAQKYGDGDGIETKPGQSVSFG